MDILKTTIDYVGEVVTIYEKRYGGDVPLEDWTDEYIIQAFGFMIDKVCNSLRNTSSSIPYMHNKQLKRASCLKQTLSQILQAPGVMEYVIHYVEPDVIPEAHCRYFCEMAAMLLTCLYDGAGSEMSRRTMQAIHRHKCVKLPEVIGFTDDYLDGIEEAGVHALDLLLDPETGLNEPEFPIMIIEFVYGQVDDDVERYEYCDTDIYHRPLYDCEGSNIIYIYRSNNEPFSDDG